MTPFVDIYNVNIQYYGSIEKLKLIIVVRGDLQDTEMIGDTWYTISSMRNVKYFLVDYANHKAMVHQLDFIGTFIQANVRLRVYVKLDSIYGKYFP